MAAATGIGLAGLVVAAPPANAYTNCAQARAAGAAPLYAGQPGYSRNLDRDGDGVACETGSGGGGYVPAAPFVPIPNTPEPAPVPSTTAAPAPAPAAAGEVCYDWMKLRTDPATGEEQVCGANTSPAQVFYWLPATPMPGGVHDAGSACPGVPLFTFARSTDDYTIWCAEGTHLLLPGKVTVNDPPQPIWALYSP